MTFLNFFNFKKRSKIAKSVKIYPFSIITNSTIGEYTYISYSCIINNCTIGKYCSIARNVKIGLGKHPSNFMSTSPLFFSSNNPLNIKLSEKSTFDEFEKVTIGNDVWIGTNAVILDGITIGDGAIIGANSVVVKDVLPYSIVGGIPAKELKKRFPENIINSILESKWWDMPIDFLKNKKVVELFSKELTENSFQEIKTLIKDYKN